MRFLDANVFLYALREAGPRGDKARKELGGVAASTPAVTSPLVLDEVFWHLRKADRRKALEESRKFLKIPGLRVLPVTAACWSRALDLMQQHGHLKPADALHAATALESGVLEILTSDDDFDGIPGLRRVDYS